MAFDTDVNAKSVASGQSANVVSASRSRLKGFFLSSNGAGAGLVTFSDGGTEKFNVSIAANSSDTSMHIPEQGVVFKTNLAVTTANATVTVFYTGA